MNNGCQCVSSDNPCLPEIFGDSADYYTPGDGKDLSLRIKEVLFRNEFDQKSASQRAIMRASQFSWDICAEKTVEQFMLAIEEFKRENKG
jgi:glycosyltransferase involved in cell wall biosynthesis